MDKSEFGVLLLILGLIGICGFVLWDVLLECSKVLANVAFHLSDY